jgi:hypothetical protein
MKDSAYVVFSKKGLQRMMKGRQAGGSRARPQLGRGEFAVLVTFDVPDSIFNERPVPEATVRIPERQIIEAPIDVEVNDPPGPPDILDMAPEEMKRRVEGEKAVWVVGKGWVQPSEVEAADAGDNRSTREAAGLPLLREPGNEESSDHGSSSTPEPEGEVRGLPNRNLGSSSGSAAG